MAVGDENSDAWIMDRAQLLPIGADLGAELGSLEPTGATEEEVPSSTSSMGSWADECERADTALAAAEDQMGRKDRDLLAELDAAMAPLHPRHPEPGSRPIAQRRINWQWREYPLRKDTMEKWSSGARKEQPVREPQEPSHRQSYRQREGRWLL